MPAAKATGRVREYCGDTCRRRASRRRRVVPWPPVAPPSYPADPETVRQRTAAALVSLLEGDHPAPAMDQLSQGLLEVDWLAYRFAALERELPRRLAGRAGELGRVLRAARVRLFPTPEEA